MDERFTSVLPSEEPDAILSNVPGGHPVGNLERAELSYSDEALVFLQVVYNAHQQRYDEEWEYESSPTG